MRCESTSFIILTFVFGMRIRDINAELFVTTTGKLVKAEALHRQMNPI